MRSLGKLAAILMIAVPLVACDSDEPLQVGSQTISVSFAGVGATLPSFNVWDLFEDSNPRDGEPDDVDGDGEPDLFLFCTSPASASGNPTSVPWPFGIEISVARGGRPDREVITSAAAIDPGANFTAYDPRGPIVGVTPDRNPVNLGARQFVFINPRSLTRANRAIVAATSNPLSDLLPSVYGAVGAGLCSNMDPGVPSIDGQEQPFTFAVNKGDTVFVSAIRSDTELPGIAVTTPPAIDAALMLDGQPVTVNGSTTSEALSGSTLAFSFTVR